MLKHQPQVERKTERPTLKTRLAERGDRGGSYDLNEEKSLLDQFDEWIQKGEKADQKTRSISYARFKTLMGAVAKEYDEYFGAGAVKDVPGLWLDFMRLRFRAHEQVEADLRRRAEENPRPTDEERQARIFYEELESPVRDAVFALRRKGYPTILSGFFVRGSQMICFEPKAGETYDPHFSPEFIGLMREKYGVALRFADAKISFLPSRPLTMRELHEIWRQIEQSVPDRGAAAPQVKGNDSKWDEIFDYNK